MNKTYKVILVIVLLSIVVLVTGVSYAYFKATISGDSETISIKAGKMGLTFDDGTSLVSLPNARPGDSITKDFNVENKSTVNSTYDYEYKYNIKLVNVNVTFQEEDLEYILEEYTDGTYTTLKSGGVKESGFINSETITEDNEMYIAARITRPPKGEKHYFRLTITFKNLEEVDQNYNQGATFSAKINIDDNKDPAFGSSDLELAVNIIKEDGSIETRNEFPKEEDGAVYVKTECDNPDITIAKWNANNWSLIVDSKGPNRCTVTFKDGYYLKTYVKNLESEDITTDDTKDLNVRYIGQNPKNYIWFNCNDYNEEINEENCEKWRIIGLMNNMTIVDEEGNKTTKQSLVKIIRADKIGDIVWDTEIKNDWARPAALRKGLNGPYLNDSDTGEWINQAGYTYRDTPNIKDESYKGITSSTKNMIEQVTWNIGGAFGPTDTKVSTYYTYERGDLASSDGTKTTWDGHIGLMYVSDYGYATRGGSQYNRQTCLAYKLNGWGGTGYVNDCAGNDWLLDSSGAQWTLTASKSFVAQAFYVNSTGRVSSEGAYIPHIIRPTLYLKSSVKIKSDDLIDGSSDHPYVLVP